MNKEPETYEELIRMKRCIDLTKYYELSKEDLEKIYDFLEKNKIGQVRGGAQNISLIIDSTSNAEIITSKRTTTSIDGILLTNELFKVIPHYTPSSYSSFSSGGSSSNNNNNNNNNNR